MSELPYGLGAPYIDIDEQRDTPLPHRYVHGGFADSDTRFSFYFPPKEQYRGRLYQYLEGGTAGHETFLAAGGIFGPDDTFRLVFEELGGYLVESNQGHFPNDGTGTGSDLVMFGASAESARYSKEIAAEMYGEAPHHSYVYGGSGGGIRSLASIEGAPDVWDGAVPSIASISTVIQGWSAIGLWWLHARHRARRHRRRHGAGRERQPVRHVERARARSAGVGVPPRVSARRRAVPVVGDRVAVLVREPAPSTTSSSGRLPATSGTTTPTSWPRCSCTRRRRSARCSHRVSSRPEASSAAWPPRSRANSNGATQSACRKTSTTRRSSSARASACCRARPRVGSSS